MRGFIRGAMIIIVIAVVLWFISSVYGAYQMFMA